MTGDLRTVRLLAVPVALHRRAAEHGRTIRRELDVLDTGGEGERPAGLQQLSEEVHGPYAAFMAAFRPAFDDVLVTSSTVIDVQCAVPPSAADVAEHVEQVLDDIDAFCRAGSLITHVPGPDVIAYRKWLLGQFVHQLRHGGEPQPYREVVVGDHVDPPGGTVAAAVVVVEDDLDLEGAEAVREAIAAAVEHGARVVTLDLSACTFIDSVGVSLLLTTWVRLDGDGGRLSVVHVSDRVRTTLEHAGVLEMLSPR